MDEFSPMSYRLRRAHVTNNSSDMIRTLDNYNLTAHNTFAMNVKCSEFMEYTKADDIPFIISSIRKGVEKFHIGAGSNLLFTGDFPGIILHSAIKGIEILSETAEEVIVRAGAGETMDELILWACRRGLWGIENLSGIPGEVGASAVQNVGAYGAEAADSIVAVHAYDEVEEEFVTFTTDECHYAYRDSVFKQADFKKRYIIHAVDYRLSPIPAPDLSYPALKSHFEGFDESTLSPSDIRKAIIEIRNSKLPDPVKVPSAGSFFKNPVISEELFAEIRAKEAPAEPPHYKVSDGYKIPAAWLIDRCGWKGYRDGNTGVWHLQPLVIVNPDRQASPEEVISLETRIIDSVKQRFGIKLTPEVEHI
ncbi:UDP-N-acetylmuramate dehydrogenase [Duncaniella sp. C9]|nr:UDP-N-acetylmuramate dehydrogenase [Duncaniella sp. C9]QCP73428.1 UDP-N-acetylmuramate dehydrogenase [Duncaniella sp. B8]